MASYGECNTAEVDVAADTETLVLDTSIPSGKQGRIKKIRVNGGPTATTAASVSGYVELKLGTHSGPFRFPCMGGNYDADLGVSAAGMADEIEMDIPVLANETVKGYLTLDGAVAGCHVGIIWMATD